MNAEGFCYLLLYLIQLKILKLSVNDVNHCPISYRDISSVSFITVVKLFMRID